MRTVQEQRSDVEQYLDAGFLDLDGLLDALELVVEPSSSLFGKPGLRLRKCPADRRKIAIAISGGGAAGAYNAGLLEVLLGRMRQRGIEPDLLVGTSSGAINGYGVFLESLGMGNPQFDSERSVRQPYESYIASVWSYMARDSKASRWVVGRRSWIVRLVSRGARKRWSIAGLILAAVGALLLVQPNLLLPLAVLLADPGSAMGNSDSLSGALPFLFGYALVTTALLSVVLWLVLLRFGQSLFLDLPLLRFLANTGPRGDLRRYPSGPKGHAVDQAKVLSRNIVRRWYERGEHAPEFIITGTDISARRECLFTLVRPETYGLLRARRVDGSAVRFRRGRGARVWRASRRALYPPGTPAAGAGGFVSRAGRVPDPTDRHLRGWFKLCGPPPFCRRRGDEQQPCPHRHRRGRDPRDLARDLAARFQRRAVFRPARARALPAVGGSSGYFDYSA